MNMKDTVILLIFLLAVMGVILGIQYSESDIEGIHSPEGKEVVTESDNGTIIITIEEKNPDYLGNIFT